jgi:hypothetical protein
MNHVYLRAPPSVPRGNLPASPHLSPLSIPHHHHPHREHSLKSETELIPFNFQENGASRWSGFYKAMGPGPKKKTKRRTLNATKEPLYTHKKWSTTMDYAEKVRRGRTTHKGWRLPKVKILGNLAHSSHLPPSPHSYIDP